MIWVWIKESILIRILQNYEMVEIEFTQWRDLDLFTTKCIVLINLQGWEGKKFNSSLCRIVVELHRICHQDSQINHGQRL